MSHIRTIISGMAGVVVMTLFSTLVSLFSRYDFTEHNVLARLLNRLKINKRTSRILGWKGHLLAGIGFSYLNKLLIEKRMIRPKVIPALAVGLLEGLIGIGIWKIAFILHPKPPKINLKKYFYHLIFAHMIYASVSVLSLGKKA